MHRHTPLLPGLESSLYIKQQRTHSSVGPVVGCVRSVFVLLCCTHTLDYITLYLDPNQKRVHLNVGMLYRHVLQLSDTKNTFHLSESKYPGKF